jgi:hypothetical protein
MTVMRARWFTKRRSHLLGALAAVLVLSAAACGGGGSSTTTTSASGTTAEEWASGVCSSFTTWKTSMGNIKASTTGSLPSKSQLQKAGQDIVSATQTLAKSLKELGKPETAQGQAARQNVDTLATTLQNDVDKIQQTLKSSPSGTAGTMSTITTLSTTVAAMAGNLKLAGENLKNFAPSGELQQAFHQADACKPYINS